MARNDRAAGLKVSRRRFLGTAVVSGGALFGVGLIGASPAAAKLPQRAAKYQSTPKGKAQCDNCSLWQPPSSCKVVDGKISPSGWCLLYQAKH